MKLRKTDRLFSNYIRTRDKWTCQRCGAIHSPGSNGLHCSHYWGRGRENIRFDEDNCIALCFGCHQIWGHGDGRNEYTDFMKQRLGEDGFNLLEVRAHLTKKRDDKADELIIRQMLKELEIPPNPVGFVDE